MPYWFLVLARHRWWLPRTLGVRRGEVKEERRAQPDSGDTSGGGHPAASARTKNVSKGPFGDTFQADSFLVARLASSALE